MSFKRGETLTSLNVPYPQGVVIGARDGPPPIRRYRHAIYPIVMSFEHFAGLRLILLLEGGLRSANR